MMRSLMLVVLLTSFCFSQSLKEQGEQLFFNETFGGNGRTCGTCHRPENNMRIDRDFIATLPLDDPLFVSELPASVQRARGLWLPAFNPRRPFDPAFEWPAAMRGLGLVGMDTGDVMPRFRAVRPAWNLAHTAPYGLKGTFPTLREFTSDAIRQHLTRRVERVPGRDFRVPTDQELDALVAFQMSLTSHDDFDPLRLIDRFGEPFRTLATNGLADFAEHGCVECHSSPVLSGGMHSNGMELMNTGFLPPEEGPFSTPQLFGLFTLQFGHNGLRDGIWQMVNHYNGQPFHRANPGRRIEMSLEEVNNIAYFLAVLSVPD